MKNFKYENIRIPLLISVGSPFLIIFLWYFGSALFAGLLALVKPSGADFNWWKASSLILIGTATGLLAEVFSPKKVSRYASVLLSGWFVISVAAAQMLKIDLVFIPLTLTILSVVLLIHLKNLWRVDGALTDSLMTLASAGHLLEGKSADTRIESGLRLLETVLPLSEAIVFRYTADGKLNPIGRARTGSTTDSFTERQSQWREKIELCEEALKRRETVVLSAEDEQKSARLALPLIYSNQTVGVLFVQINQNFERADQSLLEAFGEQLARNFQRRDLHDRILPQEFWRTLLSTESAENRLDLINLVYTNHQRTIVQHTGEFISQRSLRRRLSRRDNCVSEPENSPFRQIKYGRILRN